MTSPAQLLSIGHINQTDGQIVIAEGEIIAYVPDGDIYDFLKRFCISRQSCVKSYALMRTQVLLFQAVPTISYNRSTNSKAVCIISSAVLKLKASLPVLDVESSSLGKYLWFHGISG